MYVLKECNS